MCCHEKKEEGKCCIVAHKEKIVPCLVALVLVKIVFIGLVCVHKYHEGGCCKKAEKLEE